MTWISIIPPSSPIQTALRNARVIKWLDKVKEHPRGSVLIERAALQYAHHLGCPRAEVDPEWLDQRWLDFLCFLYWEGIILVS